MKSPLPSTLVEIMILSIVNINGVGGGGLETENNKLKTSTIDILVSRIQQKIGKIINTYTINIINPLLLTGGQNEFTLGWPIK